VSETEVTEVAMAGNSAADHQRLEQHFVTLAARYDREATDHAAYAKSWRSTTKVSTAPVIAAHCDRVATERRAAAQEARAAAAMHKAEAAKVK
jgi:hypothetical protein